MFNSRRFAFSSALVFGLCGVHMWMEAQAPTYRRPPPPSRDSVFEMRVRYMFSPEVAFQGLGNVPFREDYVVPGDPFTGAERQITYDNGGLRQDYHQIRAEDGSSVLNPTTDGFTNAFRYENPGQIRDGGAALAFERYSSVATPDTRFDGKASGSMGWELGYTRFINRSRNLGFQVGFSFNGFDSSFNNIVDADLIIQEFIHHFAAGQTAPDLPPPNDDGTQPPYQGSNIRPEEGGSQISFTPSEMSERLEEDAARVRSQMEMRSAMYTFRAGPTYSAAFGQRINLNIGAGLSAVYYDGQFMALETLENADGGTLASRPRSMTDEQTLQLSGYVDANAAYFLNERVSLFSGLQYQSGGDHNQRNAEREVNVDFRSQIYVHTGIGIRF